MGNTFKRILGTALPIVGAATGNPFLAAAGGAAGGAMQGGTRGAITGGVSGGLGSFLGNKLFGGGTSTSMNPLKALFGGGGGGNPSPMSSASSYLAPRGANPSLFSKAMAQESSVGSGFKNFFKNPLALGLGTMVGSQFIKSPEVPELPQSVIDFQNATKNNPLNNKAQEALMTQLNQTQQDLSQDEINAINRQYDLAMQDELKSIDSTYKSLRPGTDPLTDSAYQKDLGRVRDRYATLRADSVAQAQRQISNDFNNQRIQQISQAAGLSNQQLQQLSQLSQIDLDRQLMQLQITDRDRQVLRDYLLQFGGNIVNSQMDPAKALEMQLYQKLLSGGL